MFHRQGLGCAHAKTFQVNKNNGKLHLKLLAWLMLPPSSDGTFGSIVACEFYFSFFSARNFNLIDNFSSLLRLYIPWLLLGVVDMSALLVFHYFATFNNQLGHENVEAKVENVVKGLGLGRLNPTACEA